VTQEPLNEAQQRLVDSHDGIYKVDAGPGTGKTRSVTQRFADILDTEDVEPEDLLLLTFTDNAAEEMKERVVTSCDREPRKLRDAPISTFHSLAKRIVTENGFDVPRALGIDETVTSSTRLIEQQVLQEQRFREFLDQFISENSQYNDVFRSVDDRSSLLGLVGSLGSKGVAPTEDGWYRDTGNYLDGDLDDFMDRASERNKPNQGARGPKNSDLKNDITGMSDKPLRPEDPNRDEMCGENQVEQEYIRRAFGEDRQELKEFIHDLYLEYLRYSLSRNFLNIVLLPVLAYVLLCEEDSVRSRLTYDYTMVDEFQDTNEVQLKMAMLLSDGNIAVVGDEKQSIYGFRHAEVENIRSFEQRLRTYRQELNSDKQRIDYGVDEVEEISLRQNYRSTQQILDFSEKALTLPATKEEYIDAERALERVTSLRSNTDTQSTVQMFQSDAEVEAVLHKIQEVVDSDEHAVDGETLDYGDIAVLSRTREFALDLRRKASEHGIPVAIEGGMELFVTRPGILLLAWLRIVESRKPDRGWAVVLEEAGYTKTEMEHILEEEDYPQNMLEFKDELEAAPDISTIAATVFRRHRVENALADRITHVLQDVFDSTYRNTRGLIRFIEDSIESGATYDVDTSTRQETVTAQTIHSAKGLEYPAVFVADINQDRFPSTNSSSSAIQFDEMTGIRNTKEYDPDHQFVFRNWKTFLASKVKGNERDEERRLLYVAMTRAENHLFLSASKERPSRFFRNLDAPVENVEPDLEDVELETVDHAELTVDEPETRSAVRKSPSSEADLDPEPVGRGVEFGRKVHAFAERYARGEDVEPSEEIRGDAENVMELIDSLDGELRAEVPIKIPEDGDDRKTLYSGKIDLLHITNDKVEIIDWKTDRTRANHEQHQKQLDVYRKGIEKIYDGRDVGKRVFYTSG
jgi:ATP-dependent exoDNAse (exonuclease V) beta subunit (contains helicase and exonuclease domains)